MKLDEQQTAFLEQNRSASMVTLRPDGSAQAVRVGIALVDGKIWSSGTQTRRRTAYLRRDPRATLFVFDAAWKWLTLECNVKILEGADAPELNLRFFRTIQMVTGGRISWFGSDLSVDEFLKVMVEEQRLIYEFDVVRAYGMHGEMP